MPLVNMETLWSRPSCFVFLWELRCSSTSRPKSVQRWQRLRLWTAPCSDSRGAAWASSPARTAAWLTTMCTPASFTGGCAITSAGRSSERSSPSWACPTVRGPSLPGSRRPPRRSSWSTCTTPWPWRRRRARSSSCSSSRAQGRASVPRLKGTPGGGTTARSMPGTPRVAQPYRAAPSAGPQPPRSPRRTTPTFSMTQTWSWVLSI